MQLCMHGPPNYWLSRFGRKIDVARVSRLPGPLTPRRASLFQTVRHPKRWQSETFSPPLHTDPTA